ncbi:MAG TPA: hypothetical protein PKZ32_18940 [Candidatus Melainabacteria bacterium]|nr:hypothetical protein [Candidatus Melainabacteria bacterium]
MFAQTIETNLRRFACAAVIALTLLLATASDELSNPSKGFADSVIEQGIKEAFSNIALTLEAASHAPFDETFKKHFDGDFRKAFSHKLLEISLAKQSNLR